MSPMHNRFSVPSPVVARCFEVDEMLPQRRACQEATVERVLDPGKRATIRLDARRRDRCRIDSTELRIRTAPLCCRQTHDGDGPRRRARPVAIPDRSTPPST